MPPADILQLAKNLARATALTAKAAQESERSATILDNFEAHLTNASAQIDAVEAYDKQLVAMQAGMGNAGPALNDASFQAASAPAAAPAVVVASTGSFRRDTGDPVR